MTQTEAEFILEWGGYSEQISKAEITELTNIVNERSPLSDCWIARAIYHLSEPSDDRKWREVAGFATIFRVGYILGVRRERRKKTAKLNTTG